MTLTEFQKEFSGDLFYLFGRAVASNRRMILHEKTYVFMPPTSKNLREHTGLGLFLPLHVCLLRIAHGQELLEI